MYLVFTEDEPLVEFMYLLLTRTPGESYRSSPTITLRSLLLYLCDVFRELINSLVCCFSNNEDGTGKRCSERCDSRPGVLALPSLEEGCVNQGLELA